MNITASTLKERFQEGENLFVVDIRKTARRMNLHLGGFGIQKDNLHNYITYLKRISDQGSTIVIVCTNGYSNAKNVVKQLAKHNINAIRLEGGIGSWVQETKDNVLYFSDQPNQALIPKVEKKAVLSIRPKTPKREVKTTVVSPTKPAVKTTARKKAKGKAITPPPVRRARNKRDLRRKRR